MASGLHLVVSMSMLNVQRNTSSPSERQLSVRVPSVRKPVGLRLTVAEGLTVIPGTRGSSFHAIAVVNGRTVGEIDLSIITPDLIMDRSGVLEEIAMRRAQAFIAARDGQLLKSGEDRLPCGSAFRADAVVYTGSDGRAPTLPYQTTFVIGHPDVMLPVALVVTLTSVEPGWLTGLEFAASISFSSGAAASAQAVSALPFAV